MRLRHWVYGLAATPTFTRLDGTDLWYVVLDVPHDSRIEYKIEVIRGDHVESIQDPLNPHTARDPFGANSVLQTTGYVRPAWTLPDPEARSGTLVAHRDHSPALGREVDLNLYLPARFRPTSRYPLLIVHDGSDYLDYSSMQVVLDNLIHRLEMAPRSSSPSATLATAGGVRRPRTHTPATSPTSSCPGSRPSSRSSPHQADAV